MLLLFILSACKADTKDSDSQVNTIEGVEFTPREDVILSNLVVDAFAYDFHVDREFDVLSLWIEKYEFGELVVDNINEITTMVKGKGTIFFSTPRDITDPEDKDLVFQFSVGDERGGSGMYEVEEDANYLQPGMSGASGGSFLESKKIDGKEMVLGSIVYVNSDSMTTLTDEFHQDMEAHMDELEEYDVAYIVKAQFKQ